ncbi:hypothetical protein pb186bvf_010897 [Paramecium bursaria]
MDYLNALVNYQSMMVKESQLTVPKSTVTRIVECSVVNEQEFELNYDQLEFKNLQQIINQFKDIQNIHLDQLKHKLNVEILMQLQELESSISNIVRIRIDNNKSRLDLDQYIYQIFDDQQFKLFKINEKLEDYYINICFDNKIVLNSSQAQDEIKICFEQIDQSQKIYWKMIENSQTYKKQFENKMFNYILSQQLIQQARNVQSKGQNQSYQKILQKLSTILDYDVMDKDKFMLLAQFKLLHEDNFSLMILLDKYKQINKKDNDVYEFIGKQLYNQKNYQLSITQFKLSKKILRSFDSYFYLGQCYQKLKELSYAHKYYMKAYQIQQNPQILYYLGKLKFLQQDYEKVKDFYYQSINKDYNFIKPLKRLSHCYLQQKKLSKSLYFIQKHLQYQSNTKNLLFYGKILHEQERYQDALDIFLSQLAIYPNSQDIIYEICKELFNLVSIYEKLNNEECFVKTIEFFVFINQININNNQFLSVLVGCKEVKEEGIKAQLCSNTYEVLGMLSIGMFDYYHPKIQKDLIYSIQDKLFQHFSNQISWFKILYGIKNIIGVIESIFCFIIKNTKEMDSREQIIYDIVQISQTQLSHLQSNVSIIDSNLLKQLECEQIQKRIKLYDIIFSNDLELEKQKNLIQKITIRLKNSEQKNWQNQVKQKKFILLHKFVKKNYSKSSVLAINMKLMRRVIKTKNPNFIRRFKKVSHLLIIQKINTNEVGCKESRIDIRRRHTIGSKQSYIKQLQSKFVLSQTFIFQSHSMLWQKQQNQMQIMSIFC